MYRLGVDIGGTKINIGIFGENGTLIKNKKVAVSETKNVSETILKVAEELMCEAEVSFDEIGFCGVGIPGTVSGDGRRIIKAPNIGILNENTAEEIEKALGVPVSLVQDSRAAAWGEYLSGGGVGMKTVVCITLGTGIGCGIVMNGEILNGSLGSAGEIGHITAVPNGRKCGCGKLGCVEKYAAGYGLGITASEILGGEKNAADLFREAENGNKAAQNAVAEAVEMLGRTVVSVINLISPDCILFSGGLSAQEELYVKPIIKYVEEHCYSTGKVPTLKKACLGENAPLYGAAALESIERTKLLNCEKLIITVGNRVEDIDIDTQMENAERNLKLLGGIFEERGMTLLCEPINSTERPTYLLPNAKDVAELVRMVNLPSVKLLYDVYHQSMENDFDVSEMAELADIIGHVHIADCPGRNEPGSGVTDFTAVEKMLSVTDYSGYVGLEFMPKNGEERAFNAVKKIFCPELV